MLSLLKYYVTQDCRPLIAVIEANLKEYIKMKMFSFGVYATLSSMSFNNAIKQSKASFQMPDELLNHLMMKCKTGGLSVVFKCYSNVYEGTAIKPLEYGPDAFITKIIESIDANSMYPGA